MTNSIDSLYMSNLNYKTTEDGLKLAFPNCVRAQIVRDRETGNSKGFGFVQFETPDEAQAELDKVGGPGGTLSIDKRDVKLNYAHSKDQKGGGGFRGGMRGGPAGGRGGFRGGRGGGRGGYGGYGYGGGQGEYGSYGNTGYSDQGQSGGYGSGGYDAGNGYAAQQSGSYGGQYPQQPAYGQGYTQAEGYGGAGGNWNYSQQSYGQSGGAGDYSQQQQSYGGGQQSNWNY